MTTVIVAIAAVGAGFAVGTVFGLCIRRSVVTDLTARNTVLGEKVDALTSQLEQRDLALQALTKEREGQ